MESNVLSKLNEIRTLKNIIITGGAGFIGSNVINYLVSKYPEINFINVDRIDYCSNLKNIEVADRANYSFYKTDIGNVDFLSYILEHHQVDGIINFAAQTHVDNSFGNSITFTHDNILSLHTFLETVKRYGGVKLFIHISTDEVYGEVDDEHPGCHEERALLNPTNPYAATKAGAEFLVRAYHNSFNLPIIITRGNNVYGPYQYPEKIVARFATLFGQGRKVPIQGTGKSIRNYIYVEDVAKAIETILFQGQVGKIYNIGTKNEYNVLEIAKMIFEIVKKEKKDLFDTDAVYTDYFDWVPDRNFNDYRYAIDSSSLQKLGWSETMSFQDGLEKTVNWYLENGNHFCLGKVITKY